MADHGTAVIRGCSGKPSSPLSSKPGISSSSRSIVGKPYPREAPLDLHSACPSQQEQHQYQENCSLLEGPPKRLSTSALLHNLPAIDCSPLLLRDDAAMEMATGNVCAHIHASGTRLGFLHRP